jgi:ChrR Cupin-like domain/Putative zinc-finger
VRPMTDMDPCEQAELLSVYALRALPTMEAAAAEAHIATCSRCQRDLQALRPVLERFAGWPIDVLRPEPSLWDRLVERIGASEERPVAEYEPQRLEPQWEEVAPGIHCKLLASNWAHDRVSMLVRLAPGVEYPPHTHAGTEELHLLHGELWIDDRKLYPGDYNRAEPGTADSRVWSETGCTCVLVTSPSDLLR